MAHRTSVIGLALALVCALAALLAPLTVVAEPLWPLPGPPSRPSDLIRVAIVTDAKTLEVRGADIDVQELGVCDRCARLAWRSDVVRATSVNQGVDVGGRRASAFRMTSDRPVRVNGREYTGTLELSGTATGLTLVNELPLEDYVVGVVLAETGDRWPAEALRAQAIIARTYAAYLRMLNVAKPYHIVASVANQAFAGRVSASSPAWDAVRDTIGQVLRWEGQLFPSFYHAASGGYTDDPRLVFSARNMPALQAVRDAYSGASPHFYWSLDVKLAELGEILRRNGVRVGAVRSIEVLERTPSLRAVWVLVRGTEGDARLRGIDFRRMIGTEALRSTLFAVALDQDTAHFSGRGDGHGIGLSQWGARAMAEQGYRAREILAFYYPGATLGWLEDRETDARSSRAASGTATTR